MLSKSFLNVSNHAYTYLGYKNIKDCNLDKEIDECLFEIEKISQFNYIYVELKDRLPFLSNKAYVKLLDNCDRYYLILTTLGKRIDDKIKYYSKFDLKKSLIFDACASAYLEYMADSFENNNLEKPHTFRFCPGYGGTSTADIREIFKVIDSSKLGIMLLESNLMVPLKSMCGIIGIGKKSIKTCGDCHLKECCEFKLRGTLCYSIN